MLEAEQAYYEQHKDELLAHHAGSYVVIHSDELLGAFTSEAEAYEAALNRYGNQPVLIRRVLRAQPMMQVPALVVGAVHVADS
jgi:hypothetical protein